MTGSDSFGENPFRALAAEKFPDKDKKRQPGKSAIQGRSRRIIRTGMHSDHAAATDVQDAEDCELFLHAVGHVSTPEKGRGKRNVKNADQSGTFLLEEHCALPGKKLTDKKNKKESRACTTTRENPSQPKKEILPANGPERAFMKNTTGKPGSACAEQGACNNMTTENTGSDWDADEDAVFMQAMGQVQPLQGRGRDIAPAPEAGNPPPQGQLGLQDFMEGKLEFALSFTDEYIEGHVVGLDQMIMNKLRAGSLSPEGHLDLHGLNAVQAFEALRGFLRGCWYKGLRTVLIVPGRGRNSPDGIGILREKLQIWLTQEPLKRVVLAFCTAQAHDGGPGSVYVLLRKYRKKGRIYWERLPADSDLY